MVRLWTAEADQKLLLLLIDSIKPAYAKVAQDWAEKYPDNPFQPTAKAIREYVAGLKKTANGKGGSIPATPAKKNTPSKQIMPKTPRSKRTIGGKRKRDQGSEDEESMGDGGETDDDSEPEVKILTKRMPSSRHSAAKAKVKLAETIEEEAMRMGLDEEAMRTKLGRTKPTEEITNGYEPEEQMRDARADEFGSEEDNIPVKRVRAKKTKVVESDESGDSDAYMA